MCILENIFIHRGRVNVDAVAAAENLLNLEEKIS